ncbi:GntR family transcriptional regulator [Paracoccus liaowanqingii]
MPALETSGDGAYRALRSDVLFGRLAPGARLRLDTLSATYGASVSTLREILHRLACEDLVTTDQRGFDVAPVTSREFRDLGELRNLLESYALHASMSRGDLDWEGRVVGAHHKLARLEALMLAGDNRRSEEWKLYDREFHHVLVSACGSAELRAAYHSVFDRYLRYLNVAVVFRGEIAAQEHRGLRDAALNRDAPCATALLHRHIDGCVTHSVTHELLSERGALADRTDPGRVGSRPRTPVTVGEAGWLRLRRDILEGHLAPGQKLRLDRMRADYGLSISTLREILNRLASEGIVLAEGQRGFEVAPVSLENLTELVDLYRLLADHAIGCTLEQGDLDWESRFVAACHPLDAHEAALIAGDDDAMNQWRQGQSFLFQVLIDACGSVALRQLHGTILDKLLRYCCLARARSAAAITAIDHHSLRDAALRRDAGQAKQLLADHLTRLLAQIRASGLLAT